MNSVRARLMTGMAWLTGTRALINAVGFVSTIIMARILTPGDFGLVAIGTAFQAILNSVTEMSLSNALIQMDEATDEHLNSAWTMNVIRGGAVAIILACAANPISHWFHDNRLSNILLSLSVSSLILGFYNPRLALITKNLVFWQDFFLSSSSKIAGFVFSVSYALVYRSYWAIVIGIISSQIVTVALSYVIVRYRPTFNLRKYRELMSFSIWLTFAEALNTLNWKTDQLLVGWLLDRTALGAYTVGGDLAGLPTREAMAPLTQILFPGFVAVSSDRNRLREAIRVAQSLIFALIAPIGVGFSILAEPIVNVVLGPKWQIATFVIQYMAVIYALQTVSATAQPVAMALGKTKTLFWRDVLIFVTRLPPVLIGLWIDGFRGAVIARAGISLVHIVINAQLVREISGLSLGAQFRSIGRSIFSLSTMVIVLEMTHLIFFKDSFSHISILTIAFLAMLGATTYYATHLFVWFFGGKPVGPESKMIEVAQGLLRRNRTATTS